MNLKMKNNLLINSLVLLALTSGVSRGFAQGSAFTYQGRLNDGPNLANGNYEILFRPFGVSTGGSQLTIPNIRLVNVSNGLFTTSMDFGATIFDGGAVFLQLEVRTNGGPSYTVLSPRQQITPAPYSTFAAQAATVPNNAIGSAELANSIELGTTNTNGRLDVYRTTANTPALSLIGGGSQISAYGSDGQEKAHLSGSGWGLLYLNNGRPSNDRSVTLGSQTINGGGYLGLGNTNGSTRVMMQGQTTEAGGGIFVYDQGGSITMELNGASSGGNAAQLLLKRADGTATMTLSGAESSTTGSQLTMKQANGIKTVQLDGEFTANGGGFLRLYKGDGTTGITLQADASGEGKVTTQVLQITGGSDLSEQFEIAAPDGELKPGTIVCIDPENPGHLIASSKAYDHTVAGIVSGAGGVKPGMLMGQAGTAADGKHPVALSGRVYCLVDASHGAVHPGDLITTSNTPGHGMKAQNHHQAQGAIIGKAMSSLEKGEGLILVLVSLQ
jgi:hypothetical protein